MRIMQSYIILKDLRFYAYHGVGAQETQVGNEFVLDLRLRMDWTRAIRSDDVNDTLSYAEVYEAVKDEMARPSRLLEHVAGRIARRLFQDFSSLEEIELRLVKRNPPMGADIEGAGVELRVQRGEED
ncbi:MAG: dihydroneopterin aldolase [Candidatus Bacteroides intestinipullorum]|uniref:7,8-dihydroneopterin aldolase n=1 Tax=Candidatus Bacteroides intestinipullorum TaxID=2838471 RepID=A0A9E2KFL7_9BACE|nr:dihydroneopterin aldolase [Candidatus Bacteroides intestinipullorum]